jgi:GNAT superfamily N-acetyltransferase
VDDLVFVTVGAASDAAQAAMRRYFAELDTRFADGFDGAAALVEAPSAMDPPRGCFVLALVDGATVACGGVQFVDEHTGEIKRMWVDPLARGRGLGRQMLATLERVVADSGRRRAILDTNSVLAEAIAMYGAAGYHPIDRYNDNPYAHHWFEKWLGDDDETPDR